MTNDRVKETVCVCCPDVTETLARAISSMFESHIRSLSTILVTQSINRGLHFSTNDTCYCIHIHNSLRLKEYESDFLHNSSAVRIRNYLSKLARSCCVYHLLACWMSSNRGCLLKDVSITWEDSCCFTLAHVPFDLSHIERKIFLDIHLKPEWAASSIDFGYISDCLLKKNMSFPVVHAWKVNRVSITSLPLVSSCSRPSAFRCFGNRGMHSHPPKVEFLS